MSKILLIYRKIPISSLFLNDWRDGVHMDTTDTFSVDSGDSDVAIITPSCAPWVLHNVIVLVGDLVMAIPDGENTVIKCGTTIFGVENTTIVGLEDFAISLDGNWGWAFGNKSLKLGNWVLWYSFEAFSVDLTLWFIVLASLIATLVWVSWFFLEFVLLGIGESFKHLTTIATFVVIINVAINELLFWEWEELTIWDLVMTFDSTGGWESPAWTAVALILNWGHSSLLGPVNFWSKIVSLEVSSLKSFVLGWLVTEESLVFSWGVVSELVYSKSEGVAILWVELGNLGHVLLVLFVSELEFLFGSVWFAEFGEIVSESNVLLGDFNLEEVAWSWGLRESDDSNSSNCSDNGKSDSSRFSHLLSKLVN